MFPKSQQLGNRKSQKQRRSAFERQFRVLVDDMVRNRRICRPCHDQGIGRYAHTLHHIVRRSQGGTNDPDNLLPVCLHCHDKIHKNIEWARSNGYLV